MSSIVSKKEDTSSIGHQYICRYDKGLNLVECCEYYASLNGLDFSELTRTSFKEVPTRLSNVKRDQFRKVLATGTPSFISSQFTSSTNEIVYTEEQILRLNSGLVVVGKDITKCKKERENKEKQEYALSLIAKHSSQYFLIVDLEGTILFIDKTYPTFTMEQVIGSNLQEYHNEEDKVIMQKCIATVLRTKVENIFELHGYIGNGEYSVFEGTVSPIIEENGDIVKLAITTIGITERKKYENELKAINNQYVNLLELTNSVVTTQDKALKFTSVLNPNRIFNERLLIGKTDRQIIIPFNEEAQKIEAIKLEVLQSGKVIRRDSKIIIDKEIFHYDLLVQPIFNEDKKTIGITCTSINITARINRKEALEESERRLNEAERIAQLGYYDIDLASGKINWSEETYRMIGVNSNEFIPHRDSFLDLIHEEDRALISDSLKEITKTKKNLDITYRLANKKKGIQYIRNLATARLNKKGEITSIFGAVQNITQQIELELELKKQQSFIQKIMDSSPSLIFILDLEKLENIFINDASESLLGYSKEEIQKRHNLFLKQIANMFTEVTDNDILNDISTTFLNSIHPADKQLIIQFAQLFIEEKSDRIFDLNFRHQHKEGYWIWLHHRIISFNRNKEGKVTQILGIVSDITGLKESETKSKMAMIEGQEKERQRIAKDLHDAINPLLSAAKLNVESLQCRKEQDTNLSNIVSLLSQSMEAIKDISFDLMPSILKDFGLVFTLRDYCRKITEGGMLKVNLDVHGIEKRLEITTEIMLFRIAQELINNTIKHANASQVDVQLIAHQKTLILMVEDNGKGIDNTTNVVLSKSYGLKNVESRTKAFNGNMVIDSIKNRGTIITIEIPRK